MPRELGRLQREAPAALAGGAGAGADEHPAAAAGRQHRPLVDGVEVFEPEAHVHLVGGLAVAGHRAPDADRVGLARGRCRRRSWPTVRASAGAGGRSASRRSATGGGGAPRRRRPRRRRDRPGRRQAGHGRAPPQPVRTGRGCAVVQHGCHDVKIAPADSDSAPVPRRPASVGTSAVAPVRIGVVSPAADGGYAHRGGRRAAGAGARVRDARRAAISSGSRRWRCRAGFDPGQLVFREGDDSDTCYIVRDGQARAIRSHTDGRTITLATFGPGDIFGELAMFEDERRSATVEAIEPTTVVGVLGRRHAQADERTPGHRDAAGGGARRPPAGDQRAPLAAVLPDRPEPRGRRPQPARGGGGRGRQGRRATCS